MKSLALRLMALLLLGTLQIATSTATAITTTTTTSTTNRPATTDGASAFASTVKSAATTRQRIRSSLLAPHPLLSTTEMTTTATTTTTTMTTSLSSSSPEAAAKRQPPPPQGGAPLVGSAGGALSAPRLVRNATAASDVRQNRSLRPQVTATSNTNTNNNNAAAAEVANGKKYRRPERRQQQPATTPPTTLPPNHRQSKQSAPEDDVPPREAPVEHATPTYNASRLQHQTLKTPRMIQRLVAGHIQNAEGRSTYQVSSVTSTSSVSHSATTTKPNPLYFRRKEPVMSSSFRHFRQSTTTTRPKVIATTTIEPLDQQNLVDTAEERDDRDDRDDDEALLDDPGDFDNWDSGILRLSAGAGKESSGKSKKIKDDAKKTLSDQVRDGKYGLIEKELFRNAPKRPGVLSYLPNKEVPIDNERNYGGLNEEDIWLAEDHLLVIKGGGLNLDEPSEPWPAIDDYDAPGRQIKLPPNPKVPPPFPVQLEENGAVQFIGNNKFTVVYPVANESIPVYTAGPTTQYASSAGDSDNEKNSPARQGSAETVAKSEPGQEPGYLYPAPYPPWLYHNQTFVNPFLSNARPISFPGLGPFPLGRNGSLDSSNGTDYFDEDDPSLYYPPAYSFVYKSNYSNPVAPGPLVPGIVLPPPANQFSRLEKPDRSTSTTASPPPRYRVYTTTTTTTATPIQTTTAIPSTTTESSFRHAITKITEYKPKTIIITPEPPSRLPPMPTPPSTALPLSPVLVPVAVPVPVYQTTRPSVVAFVPTTPGPATDTLSQSNPIYYEYFEAKRQPVTSNVIEDFLLTTVKPPTAQKPVKLYATSKRPFKAQSQRINLRPLVPENIVYITPKPEVRYNAPPQVPVSAFKTRPLENFEREVNAIRETLRYYQNQQLRDNSIPRTPKAKPLYEYSFEAAKNLEEVESDAGGNFQPPVEYDEQPFKPMVTYSPPVDDENSFKAIAYDKVDTEAGTGAAGKRTQQQYGEQEQPQPKQQQKQPEPRYQTTTTLVPIQSGAPYRSSQGRRKKLRLRAKYLQQPLIAAYQQQQQQQQQLLQDYHSTPRTVLTSQRPWVSLDKQELNDYLPQQQHQQQPEQQQQQQQQQPRQSERLQFAPPVKNRAFPGYYYGPPAPVPVPGRQNNRFYDEPFQGPPLRKIVNYRPQQNYPPLQQQQQHYPQQQQQQQQWSLENDTYVNYAPNRPPLNPDAEFINPYQTYPAQAYASQTQRLPPPRHLAISHQAQYYAPQRPPPPQARPQIPLHRDILVNYRQPLPPINPDSEFIGHPQLQPQPQQHVLRNPANPVYRPNPYRGGGGGTGGDSNVYYITPKYRRSNGSNNSDGKTNGNEKSGAK